MIAVPALSFHREQPRVDQLQQMAACGLRGDAGGAGEFGGGQRTGVHQRHQHAGSGGRILLTGRTDLLLHGGDDLDEVIRRLVAFAEVGADVLYAPGLADMDAIRAVAPKPVNVLIGPGVGLAELAAAGVRRVSLGAALYRRALGGLAEAARHMAAGDLPGAVAGAVSGRELSQLLPRHTS